MIINTKDVRIFSTANLILCQKPPQRPREFIQKFKSIWMAYIKPRRRKREFYCEENLITIEMHIAKVDD